MKKLGTGYIAFGLGVIFGATIATLTSYYVFQASLGNPEAAKVLQIQECLQEKIHDQ
tara:strand:+ start:48 stop:218 length:171 start_codon:yes stop_codon:yes gene_type:complete